ncbi:hypothetical protein GCM10010510_68170 [Streptomyces anandii JCM 4720]|nr:hypothetical protein GCM10010510_68170 [Streptomyces anandii JCM 4720]
MYAAAETEVLVVPPVGVEAVRVVETLWITTARGQHEHDPRTLGNRRAGDGDVAVRRPPRDDVDGRLVAKQFLHQRYDQTGFVAQPLQHLRVAQQCQHAVGDEVDRGFVTGDQQQVGGGDDLVIGHPPVRPVVFGHP